VCWSTVHTYLYSTAREQLLLLRLLLPLLQVVLHREAGQLTDAMIVWTLVLAFFLRDSLSHLHSLLLLPMLMLLLLQVVLHREAGQLGEAISVLVLFTCICHFTAHERLLLLLLLQVVLHREAGQLGEAISVLVTYLQHYSNDREAWEELVDMYLEVSDNVTCYNVLQSVRASSTVHFCGILQHYSNDRGCGRSWPTCTWR
jgi:hypothetical protein